MNGLFIAVITMVLEISTYLDREQGFFYSYYHFYG